MTQPTKDLPSIIKMLDEVLKDFGLIITDPMWHNHAEISKQSLKFWHKKLTDIKQQLNKPNHSQTVIDKVFNYLNDARQWATDCATANAIDEAITALRSMPVTYQVRQVDDADGDWYDVPFKTYEIFKLYPVSRRKIILLEE